MTAIYAYTCIFIFHVLYFHGITHLSLYFIDCVHIASLFYNSSLFPSIRINNNGTLNALEKNALSHDIFKKVKSTNYSLLLYFSFPPSHLVSYFCPFALSFQLQFYIILILNTCTKHEARYYIEHINTMQCFSK